MIAIGPSGFTRGDSATRTGARRDRVGQVTDLATTSAIVGFAVVKVSFTAICGVAIAIGPAATALIGGTNASNTTRCIGSRKNAEVIARSALVGSRVEIGLAAIARVAVAIAESGDLATVRASSTRRGLVVLAAIRHVSITIEITGFAIEELASAAEAGSRTMRVLTAVAAGSAIGPGFQQICFATIGRILIAVGPPRLTGAHGAGSVRALRTSVRKETGLATASAVVDRRIDVGFAPVHDVGIAIGPPCLANADTAATAVEAASRTMRNIRAAMPAASAVIDAERQRGLAAISQIVITVGSAGKARSYGADPIHAGRIAGGD